MDRNWLSQAFPVQKPVIGMLHLSALPGDPGYDAKGGMDAVLARASLELAELQAGGVDGIMFSNEFSRPYLTKTEPVTATAMARVIGQLLPEVELPFGVNVLWDGIASIDLAVATGALWVREIFTGVYASDFGLWNTNPGEAARHRASLCAGDVKLLYNVVPESAQYLTPRSLESITQTTVFATLPDGLCVSGPAAGAPTSLDSLTAVKSAAGSVPVFVNTGVRPETAASALAIADAAIVGSWFKVDGVFENPATEARVREMMTVVRAVRARNS